MPFVSESTDPKLTKVSILLRVPWVYRQQLHKLATKRGCSLNQLLVDAIESMIPPE
jgi:hypothetical protein